MQKLIVLFALLAIVWTGTRVLASMARPKPVRADKNAKAQSLPVKRLRLDEKTGLYVPSDE